MGIGPSSITRATTVRGASIALRSMECRRPGNGGPKASAAARSNDSETKRRSTSGSPGQTRSEPARNSRPLRDAAPGRWLEAASAGSPPTHPLLRRRRARRTERHLLPSEPAILGSSGHRPRSRPPSTPTNQGGVGRLVKPDHQRLAFPDRRCAEIPRRAEHVPEQRALVRGVLSHVETHDFLALGDYNGRHRGSELQGVASPELRFGVNQFFRLDVVPRKVPLRFAAGCSPLSVIVPVHL